LAFNESLFARFAPGNFNFEAWHLEIADRHDKVAKPGGREIII